MTDPYPDAVPPPAEPALAHPATVVEVAPPRRRFFGSGFAAVLVAVIVAGVGLAVGWIWAAVAPRVAVIKTANGFAYADPEPEQAVAADGWFAIVGLAAGIVLAVGVWMLLRRHRGVAVMVGLAIGSLVGASLAWWVGYKIGFAQFEQVRDSAAVGARVDAPLGLRITDLDKDSWWPPKPTGVAAVQALAATFVYTMLAGFSSYASLRGPDQPPHPASTGPDHPGAGSPGPDQLGPGLTGSSDSDTGTART